MQFFKIVSLVVILVSFIFVGWRLYQEPATETEVATVTEQDDGATEPAVQTESKDEIVAMSAEQSEILLSEPTPEPEMPEQKAALVPNLNPSAELLEELLTKYIAEEITVDAIERTYLIPEDTFFNYIYEQNWLLRSGINTAPLPEPAQYRTTTASGDDTPINLLRYSIMASTQSPLHMYAVDTAGNFSGIVRVNEELAFPYQQVRRVEPYMFAGDSGIKVDVLGTEEFTIMLKGKAFGIFPLMYSYYEEGETDGKSAQIMTTPDMLASATVVSTDNSIDIYQWRIDYDGDGEVDFLLSHNGASPEQAEELVDFVIEAGYVSIDGQDDESTTRADLIAALSASY